MWNLILFSAVAGIVGTGLGGLFGVFFKNAPDRLMSWVLSFAGGIMVSVVCFDLFPEATEMGNLWITAGGALAGVIVILVLNWLADRHTEKREGGGVSIHGGHLHVLPPACCQDHGRDPEHAEKAACELNAGNISEDRTRRGILRAGVVMMLAVMLHNLPAGLAIGAGMGESGEFGFKLALLLSLHNIPEGMTISVSLAAGGVGRWKAVGLTALSGAPTVVGGILGYLVGGISPTVMALAMGLAGGAMLYVTFCEILPNAMRLNCGRFPALFTMLGILAGFLISGLVG